MHYATFSKFCFDHSSCYILFVLLSSGFHVSFLSLFFVLLHYYLLLSCHSFQCLIFLCFSFCCHSVLHFSPLQGAVFKILFLILDSISSVCKGFQRFPAYFPYFLLLYHLYFHHHHVLYFPQKINSFNDVFDSIVVNKSCHSSM